MSREIFIRRHQRKEGMTPQAPTSVVFPDEFAILNDTGVAIEFEPLGELWGHRIAVVDFAKIKRGFLGVVNLTYPDVVLLGDMAYL